MAEEAKVPFTSTPFGRTIKTFGAGVMGYVAVNYTPVVAAFIATLSPAVQGIATLVVMAIVSGVGRLAKQHGIDLIGV